MNPFSDQWRTLLWLRWCLMKNQFSKGGELNAVITLFIVLMAITIIVSSAVLGWSFHQIFPLKTTSENLMVGWDRIILFFIFCWFIGIFYEIQRSEIIDIRKLIHLPVSLRQVFATNYIISHLSICLAIFLPFMLGLAVSLIARQGLIMGWLIPMILGFIFMITAWTYFLRGWLASLISNPRRRHILLVVMTTMFILIVNGPNIYFHVLRSQVRTQTKQVESQQRFRSRQFFLSPFVTKLRPFMPPLWIGQGAYSLMLGKWYTAGWSSLGFLAVGTLGLVCGYRNTLRFYQGTEKVKKSIVIPSSHSIFARKTLLERKLFFLNEEISVLSLAFFRILARAPEVKMKLLLQVLFWVIFAIPVFNQNNPINDKIKSCLIILVITLGFISVNQFFYNQFGFDRNGFRILVLSPIPRKYILFSKNLSFLPFSCGLPVLLGVAVVLLGYINWLHFLIGLFQLIGGFLLLNIIGNIISISFPYHLVEGSLKRSKISTETQFFILICVLCSPLILSPIYMPFFLAYIGERFSGLPFMAVNLISSFILTGVIVIGYGISLGFAGNWLQQREKDILQVVTEEVE